MSNYCSGEGFKVPFGDGNHIPIEDIDHNFPKSEIFVQSVLNQIFVVCDKEKTNSVKVSDLIDVIRPFFSENESELLELERALDPNNSNPYIDSETFLALMSGWITRLSGESFNDNSVISRDTSELPLAQSSPSNNFVRESVEPSLLNVSCNFTEFNNTEIMDSAFYQEKIKELEYQNRKFQEELKHVNNQVTTFEEQVDILQLENDKLLKKEQQLTEQLHRNQNENDEILETSTTTSSKQICKLEKKLASSEKSIQSLQAIIEELQDKNTSLEDNNKQTLQREVETKKKIDDLILEISIKEQAIMSLEEITSQLKIEVGEQKKSTEHYQSALESLKLEKKNIEKNFQEHLLYHESLIPANKSQGISPQYSNMSPIFFKNSFNTPELLSRLNNKVTSFTSSLATNPKKSVDSDGSPVFFCNKNLTKLVKLDMCSTPVQSLIDSTPPSGVRKIPILVPSLQNKPPRGSAKTKKSTLFGNYRFIGSSSDENDENEQQPSRKLRHVNNTNLVPQTSEIANSLLYIVERTDTNANMESLENGSFDLSDDEVFFNLQHANCSARSSLDSELVLADSAFLKEDLMALRHQNNELTETIEQLKKEIDELKLKASECNLKDNTPNRLQSEVEKLEIDNNLKYIKIVDLMEEKETLQNELKNLHFMYNNEISEIKKSMSHLSVEKANLEEQFETHLHEKQKLNDTLLHLKNVEHDHEIVKQRFKELSDSEKKVCKEFNDLNVTNSELKQKIEVLNQSIKKLNTENTNFKNKIKKLLDETKRLKSEILLSNKEQEQLQTDHEKLKCHLKQAREKNYELKEKLEKSIKELQFLNNSYKDLMKSKELETKQVHLLKSKEAEHLSQIKCCKELKESNTALNKKLLEQKTETMTLKDMVECQKTKIKSLEAEKSDILKKLEINEKDRERLLQENQNWQKQLKDGKNESEKLREQLILLGELNKTNQENIKTLVDVNNNALREYDLLKEEKNLVIERKNEEIVQVQSKLTDLQVKYTLLSGQYDLTVTTKDSLIQEIDQKNKESDYLNTYNQNRIASLENSNIKLKSDLEALRGYYKNLENEINGTDFLQERSNSDENLQLGRLFCKNCRVLEKEIEDANARVQELDLQVSCLETDERTVKKGSTSYMKAQIKIEKLENKLEQFEHMSKLKQEKISSLEEINTKLKQDLETSFNIHEEEKVKLEKIKISLEAKTQMQLQDNSQFETESKENLKPHLNPKKTVLLERIKRLEEDCSKLNAELCTISEEKALTSTENESLKQQLKSITDAKDSMDRTQIENTKLKNEVEEMLNCNLEFKKQIQNLKQSYKTECDRVKSLNSTIKRQEAKIDKVQNENLLLIGDTNRKLNDSLESISKENALLKKTNTELNREKDDLKNLVKQTEQDLINWKDQFYNLCKEQEIASKAREDSDVEKESQINNLQKQLLICEEALNDVNFKLDDSTKTFNILIEYLKGVKAELGNNMHILSRSLSSAVGSWQLKLQNKPDYQIFLQAPNQSEDHFDNANAAYLDEEMLKLKHQVHITSFFLEILSSMMTSNQNAEVQVSFPELLELDKSSNNLPSKDGCSLINPFIKTNNSIILNKNISINEAPSRDNSPDTSGLYVINQSGREIDLKYSQLKSSANGDEILKTDIEMKHEWCDVGSSSFSNDILDGLELVEKFQSAERTLEELEERFSVLALTFVIDLQKFEKKYQFQQSCQSDIDRQYTVKTESLVTSLSAIKQLSADHQIGKLVMTCLHQLEEHISLYRQGFQSARCWGALLHEKRFLNCMSLIVNYVEKLKQASKSESRQLKFTNTSPTLNDKESDNFLKSEMENEEEDGTISGACSGMAETQITSTEVVTNSTFPTSRGINLKQWFKSIGGNDLFREFCWCWALLFIAIGLVLLGNTIIDLEHMRLNIPLPNSFTWSDFFAPYFKLHHNAPPPM